VAFYRHVEAATGTVLLHQVPTVRIVATDREVEYLARRREQGFPEASQPEPPVNEAWFLPGRGGFQLDQGGRLDVAAYLNASRLYFERLGQYAVANLSLQDDIVLTATGVRVSRLGVAARHLFFCQGIAATENPWFQDIRFRPAKGEILTLRIHGLTELRIVNRGVWLMPIGDGLYRAGATYDWSELNSEPTAAGREEICQRLTEFLRLPFEVIGHAAAIRPILLHQYPVIGFHPDHRQLGYMNGLGSKGSLQAPALAEHLAAALVAGRPIDTELNVERYLKPVRKGLS
jgi:glycine/D-amino acid oxidase-like deaminating enzyme